MNLNYHANSSRITRALDARSERSTRFLPYIPSRPKHAVSLHARDRLSCMKNSSQTHVRRYDPSDAMTVLSIRFASCQTELRKDRNEQAFIRRNNMQKQPAEQLSRKEAMPAHLRIKKQVNPEDYLKDIGYDPDVRIAGQVYADRVEERKVKYVNRIQALRRELQNGDLGRQQDRMQRSRIQAKILGEQIRRKRERELLAQEEKKGRQLFLSVLNPVPEVLTV